MTADHRMAQTRNAGLSEFTLRRLLQHLRQSFREGPQHVHHHRVDLNPQRSIEATSLQGRRSVLPTPVMGMASITTAPSGVRTIRTSSRFGRDVRQATQDRCGTCLRRPALLTIDQAPPHSSSSQPLCRRTAMVSPKSSS